MPSHSKYGERDSQPMGEVHAQWTGGLNTVQPADRLPAMQFTAALNMEIRNGYPETRRSVERPNWLYTHGEKLGELFQGCGLLQGTSPSAVTRAPTALAVVCDDDLWVYAPNNEPWRLMAGITASQQPVEIFNAHGEHLILRGISQPPLRYKYQAGRKPRALPAPRAIGGFTQLPAAETGCYAANRVWLKYGKNHVVASDIFEWDFDPVTQDFRVDDGENDEIVRLWPYGEDRIVVFKTRSVHVIDGVSAMDTTADPPVLPVIYRVAAARGCVAPYTVCQRGSAVLYLSREGVETLDLSSSAVTSQAAMPLSKAMERYFRELRWQGISGARAAIADNYYLLSVPTRFGEARFYPYPVVVAPWSVGGDPPEDWFPTTVGEPPPEQCTLTDPTEDASEPVLGTALEALTRHDHYGQLGFEASYPATAAMRPWWDQCSYICWCDGPAVEAVPLVTEYERYSQRWRAMVSAGRFYYARVGSAWSEAPVELFPESEDLTGCTEVSLAFDANARPCFATVIAGRIELRRFVAGVPTTYSWPGGNPRLFFNGLLQRDDTLRDVVCLYLRNRVLWMRVQRDNFATEYLVVNPELPSGPYSLARLGATDRGAGALASYQLLGATTTDGRHLLLRSGRYPAWPVVVREPQTVDIRFLTDGAYTFSVNQIASADLAAAAVAFNEEGLYFSAILTLGETEAIGAAVAFNSDGAYTEAIVPAATADGQTAAVTFNSDGAYALTIIAGGSYSEGQNATVAFNADGYYSL